jgi:uncharacterized protein (TIGR03435 family)
MFSWRPRPEKGPQPGYKSRLRDAASELAARAHRNHLEAQEVTMARFAEALSRVLDRKVIDRTGKPEKFNVSLQWLPEEHAPPSGDAITLPPDTPAIFTAVKEQLGLRLEPSKALIDLLVIDYAERPSAN